MRNLHKPNRYNVASIQAQQTLGGDVMQSDENGQYVEWRDYAWLLASHDFVRDQWKDLETENSVLKSEAESWKLRSDNWQKFCQSTRPDLLNENARLKAEVERLRKAGDDLGWAVHRLKERFWDADEEANKAVQAWNAAKEGKQS